MRPSNRTIAVTASIVLHALLLAVALRQVTAEPPPPAPPAVELVLEVPPPPPPPKEPEKQKPLPKLKVASRAPQGERRQGPKETPPMPSTQRDPGPPVHAMGGDGVPVAGGGGGASGGQGKGGGGAYAPSDYADKVKSRINAAKVYPEEAKRLFRQCVVRYRLTVDQGGNLLDHSIDSCGDRQLDAAAEAAIVHGGPYPPPPNLGVPSYEIHGSLIFAVR